VGLRGTLSSRGINLVQDKQRDDDKQDRGNGIGLEHPACAEAIMHQPSAVSPIRYQRCAVSVRSATGPHKNRYRFADTPIATIEAAMATEKPARVSTNGNVIEMKPLLMP
jgi:hypothetical protein